MCPACMHGPISSHTCEKSKRISRGVTAHHDVPHVSEQTSRSDLTVQIQGAAPEHAGELMQICSCEMGPHGHHCHLQNRPINDSVSLPFFPKCVTSLLIRWHQLSLSRHNTLTLWKGHKVILAYSEEGGRILMRSIGNPDVMERRVGQQVSELCLIMPRITILTNKIVPCVKHPG